MCNEETECVRAHDALFRGMACFWKYSPKFVEYARSHFARSVAFDDNYASAHAWLARVLLFQSTLKWDSDSNLKQTALLHAQKAVAINAQLPYALSILGWTYLWFKQQDLAISSCRQAVSLDPNNAEAQVFLSFCLSASGFDEEGLFYIQKALRHNPLSSTFYEFTFGLAHYVVKDYEQAVAAFKRGSEIYNTFAPNLIYLCITYHILGLKKELKLSRESALSIMGGDRSKMIESL